MLGKITKEQRAGPPRRVADLAAQPRLRRLRASCAARFGIRVDEPMQLDAALTRALAHEGPALVEVIADPDLV